MSITAKIAIGWGALYLLLTLLLIFFQSAFQRTLREFPRHVWVGRALLFIDIVWVTWLVYVTPMENFSFLKPYLYALAPVSFFLIIKHMEELLACRALGALFLLASAPMLNAIRWHDSSWRLVITVSIYIMVVKGMALVFSPYLFRKSIEYWFGHTQRIKALQIFCVVSTLFFLTLGFRAL